MSNSPASNHNYHNERVARYTPRKEDLASRKIKLDIAESWVRIHPERSHPIQTIFLKESHSFPDLQFDE